MRKAGRGKLTLWMTIERDVFKVSVKDHVEILLTGYCELDMEMPR